MRATGPVLDSLRGLALGDAFGDRWFSAPVDEAPVDLAARLVRPAPWHWTDDTAMALVLVRHLTVHGEVRQDALAGEFAAEYAREYQRKWDRGTPTGRPLESPRLHRPVEPLRPRCQRRELPNSSR
ncbi:hypothetical protein KAURM247S_06651 [Kitasatospora aureofaciens]|uniref:ADP-ribosylglycohydrolase family protein n=1 Tax=Kitasatospora aureofaciens TaxID=1894 RepID=UPI000927E301|nr:ADP-ribosylglycohydrolase family protein [Streptomyces viridifaciens]